MWYCLKIQHFRQAAFISKLANLNYHPNCKKECKKYVSYPECRFARGYCEYCDYFVCCYRALLNCGDIYNEDITFEIWMTT